MEPESSTPPNDETPRQEIIHVKKERTQAQKDALLRAREKAMQVRQQNAAERSKIREIESHEKKEKAQLRKQVIDEEYNRIKKPMVTPVASPKKEGEGEEEEEEVQVVKRPKKKKIIRVVESSSEDEIEFQLPKRKKVPEKTEHEIEEEKKAERFERTRLKLFTVQ
jgi:hypothetical protein